MIAWKLTTDFNEQRHLFFEKVETDYVVETYMCSCGHKDFIIKHSEQKLDYMCQECENTKFYDANTAWKDIVYFSNYHFDFEFIFEYDMQIMDDKISSIYIIQIPSDIDFSSRKVIFSKKQVCSLVLESDGELTENYLLKFNQEILATLKKNLTQYINNNRCFNIPDSGDKELNLTMASFFLKNKHLKDFDFYYWNKIEEFKAKDISIDGALEMIANYPKEKSVRKAYYKHYIEQLYNHGCFYSSFLEAFCINIKDTNILVRLLNIVFTDSLYRDIHREHLNEVLNFLTQYYSDKQILNLFSSSELQNNEYLLKDTLSEFNYSKDVIENKFRKVACKIESLHDEFVRCTKEERYKHIHNQILDYTNEELKPCIKTNNYQVKVPKIGKELFDWADDLHNCMAGYFDEIKNNKTIIYGFFEEDVLSFAVEISDKRVVQSSGKYNADLTIIQHDIFIKWFELFFKEDRQVIINVA